MRRLPASAHLALASSLLLWTVACATSEVHAPQAAVGRARAITLQPQGTAPPDGMAPRSLAPASRGAQTPEVGHVRAGLLPVGLRALADGRLKLFLPPLPPNLALELLSVEEVRPLLTAFAPLHPPLRPQLRLLESPGWGLERSATTRAETKLREEFLDQFGPALLPLPESLASSRLLLALQLSTRYMAEGVREAARELFNSPAFVLGVCLSIGVYFAAWLAPEPFFSKAFAATLTARLALLVGLVELGQVAHACLKLYQDVEAARTPQELEAASASFGKAMGGTGLRVLVVVVSMGLGRMIPQVPEGGIWSLLPSVGATSEGAQVALRAVATAEVVADGTLVVTGTMAGEMASACSELGPCTMMANSGAGSGARLPTRYGPPHTRQNPPHNKAIEKELAAREAAGHSKLAKNKAQMDATGERVLDRQPVNGVRFRRPDASSVRPDGVRHNTNYVSNPKNLKDELEAFESMVRSDPKAIHELYRLDGTLVRRFVPPGVSYP